MVKVGEQIGSVISNPCATPLVRAVFPTPKSPKRVNTSPGFASFPIFTPNSKVSVSLKLSKIIYL